VHAFARTDRAACGMVGCSRRQRHDRALRRTVTRLPIELAIVSLEQVSLVQDKADPAQQVKGRWRGGIG